MGPSCDIGGILSLDFELLAKLTANEVSASLNLVPAGAPVLRKVNYRCWAGALAGQKPSWVGESQPQTSDFYKGLVSELVNNALRKEERAHAPRHNRRSTLESNGIVFSGCFAVPAT